ncbi:hypothetical protein AaE_001718, partial [Aphanomyces astaci]
ISFGSLHRYLKKGLLRAHSSAIRPILTNANKYCRLKYALNFVKPNFEISEMLNYVHLDEKWFYLTRQDQKYYLVPGESEPDRKCKSKRYITKVMFVAAVARPRYLEDTCEWWDGKIGLWPFTTLAAAQHSSANRPAGTLETKTVNVTKDVYRTYLLEKVLPAIVRKWPGDTRDIILQHDNAKTHVTVSDKRLKQSFDTYKSAGCTFRLEPQPPNSPDFNVLDLGFFAALLSLQHREAARCIDELVDNVENAFKEYPSDRLDCRFMTLQTCLLEAMKVHGDNTYKIPHLSKEKKQRRGMLGRNVCCSLELHADAAGMLQMCDREAMDAACAAELTDLRGMDELSRVLEEMTLGGDDYEDLAHALVEVGIDTIDLSSSDV